MRALIPPFWPNEINRARFRPRHRRVVVIRANSGRSGGQAGRDSRRNRRSDLPAVPLGQDAHQDRQIRERGFGVRGYRGAESLGPQGQILRRLPHGYHVQTSRRRSRAEAGGLQAVPRIANGHLRGKRPRHRGAKGRRQTGARLRRLPRRPRCAAAHFTRLVTAFLSPRKDLRKLPQTGIAGRGGERAWARRGNGRTRVGHLHRLPQRSPDRNAQVGVIVQDFNRDLQQMPRFRADQLRSSACRTTG